MSESMGSKTQKVVALFGNLVAVMSEKYSLVEHEHAIEGGLGGKPASLVWGFGWSDKAALRVSFGPSPSAPGPEVWSSLMPASLVEIAPHMPALVSALEKKVVDVDRAIKSLNVALNIMHGRAGAPGTTLGMLKYVNGNFEPAATPPEPAVAARPAPETSEALKVCDFTFVVCRQHSGGSRQYIMRYHGARPLWTHDIGSAMVFPEADARAECKDAHRRGAPSDEIPWTYGVMGKPAPTTYATYARAELAKGSGLTASSTVSSATAAENVRSLAVFRLLPWEGREFWGHPTKGWVRNPMDAIALSLEEAKARLAVLRTASTAKLGYTYGAMNIPTMQIAIDAAP